MSRRPSDRRSQRRRGCQERRRGSISHPIPIHSPSHRCLPRSVPIARGGGGIQGMQQTLEVHPDMLFVGALWEERAWVFVARYQAVVWKPPRPAYSTNVHRPVCWILHSSPSAHPPAGRGVAVGHCPLRPFPSSHRPGRPSPSSSLLPTSRRKTCCAVWKWSPSPNHIQLVLALETTTMRCDAEEQLDRDAKR